MNRIGYFLLLSLALAGCRGAEVDVADMVTLAAKLEKTKQSSSTPLQDELRRLSADRALPEQIDGRRNVGALNPESFAGRVHEILDDAQTERILKRLPDFYSDGRVSANAVSLESAAGFLKFYAGPHAAARKALDGSQSSFQWLAAEGWFADTKFIDRATALCGLELIAGLDAASREDNANAIAALSYAGRIIRLLAEDGHLLSRLAAVDLRVKWLHLVEAVVREPATSRTDVQAIYELLMRQMAQWPDETVPWQTDRAIGLQTFEIVRHGHYLSLLSKEESDALTGEGMHLIKARAVQRYIDEDQVFYLDIMRRLIELQRFPYFEGKKVLNSLDDQISAANQLEKYPQISVELLLPNTLKALRRIADDRARCEAWVLGLAKALNTNPPEYVTNPETGYPYEVLSDAATVEVLGLSPEQWPHSIRVPIR
ncbi:MAG: hypothetical protein JNL67_15495 [Planctomycetaceae bacterium]|nr:hypothetical protein [Planctomycetaceae bacterium]